MLQIVYTSAANQEFSTAELERLLAGARRRNRTVGVTGMLVFHDGGRHGPSGHRTEPTRIPAMGLG